LKEPEGDDNIDFVLCIGDSKADEEMFTTIDEMLFMKESGELIMHPISCFTSTIRRKPKTNARYYIPNQPAVIDLLEKLSTPTKISSVVVVPPQTKFIMKSPSPNLIQPKNYIPSTKNDNNTLPPLSLNKIPSREKNEKKKKRTIHLSDLMSKMLGTGKL